MSWTNVLTTHEFWAGSALRRSDQCGDFPIITARSVRASDRRKATQEDAMQIRKETREDKLHDEESLYSAAQEFAQVATEIPTETIDAKGVFNILRDWYNHRAGRDDPKAMDKREDFKTLGVISSTARAEIK